MNSTYNDCLSLTQSTIANLGLTLDGVSPPVVVRKLPLRQETIDPSTQIIVCPAERPEEYVRLSFNNHYTFSPLVQVVIISPNNAQETNDLDTYLDWREQIATAMSNFSVGLALQIEYDVPLDRDKIALNYDYLSLGWRPTLWV